MAENSVENTPIGTEARTELINTRTQEIMMGRLATVHTGDTPSTYGHPASLALREIMNGYTQGDITPEDTIFYFQRLQPWLSDNGRGIREEDIAVFSGLKTGKHVVADNQIRRLAGKPPTLAAQEAPTSMPLRSQYGWARSGIDLAVTFDAQPTPEQDNGTPEASQQSAQFDFTVSMHGLYDRLAVGKRGISEYVDYRCLTPLQGNETCWQHATDAFNSPLPFEAWGDAVLLRSLYESGFSEHVRAPSLQRLAQSVAANTE